MFLVEDFYQRYGKELGLELIAGREGLRRPVRIPEVHRAGLALSGYVKNYAEKRILVMGRVEAEYLRTLDSLTRIHRLESILTEDLPCVILARRYRPSKDLFDLCSRKSIPLFKAPTMTVHILNRVSMILAEEFAPIASRHGTFVEVFDVGVLIEGESSIGKSETALGLIERGHRLISDDVVRIKKKKESYLEGHGVELTRHHMEIRGIGIINVANLYGAFCVRDKKQIDLIVKLETWDENNFYDRVGASETKCSILGVEVPFSILPVKPGRDVVLLVEALALNYRLKKMGYHSAKEFQTKLQRTIAVNQNKRRMPL